MQALARFGLPILHPTAPHGMIYTSIPHKKKMEQWESLSAFLLMKKTPAPLFSFSPL